VVTLESQSNHAFVNYGLPSFSSAVCEDKKGEKQLIHELHSLTFPFSVR